MLAGSGAQAPWSRLRAGRSIAVPVRSYFWALARYVGAVVHRAAAVLVDELDARCLQRASYGQIVSGSECDFRQSPPAKPLTAATSAARQKIRIGRGKIPPEAAQPWKAILQKNWTSFSAR
jgi:hypothetical protein